MECSTCNKTLSTGIEYLGSYLDGEGNLELAEEDKGPRYWTADLKHFFCSAGCATDYVKLNYVDSIKEVYGM